jgi:hypothetical protein
MDEQEASGAWNKPSDRGTSQEHKKLPMIGFVSIMLNRGGGFDQTKRSYRSHRRREFLGHLDVVSIVTKHGHLDGKDIGNA